MSQEADLNVSTMPFDEPEQNAIVAWCAVDAEFFENVHRGVKQADFRNVVVSRIYKGLCDFYGKFRRLPTEEELVREQIFAAAEKLTKDKMVLIYKEQFPELRKKYGLDVLKDDVELWMKTRTALETQLQFNRLYNQSIKNKDALYKALAVWEEGANKVSSTSFDDGVGAGFVASNERLKTLTETRRKKQRTRYNIPFLDDALGGYSDDEVVLVGAKTGVGKTMLVTHIASSAARQGRRVNFFVLEGSENEVENRIVYTMLAGKFFDDPNRPHNVPISFGRFMGNELDDVFSKYLPEVEKEFMARYATMKTLYRSSGGFTLNDLERHIKRCHGNSDLIILDHIHYIDLDADNENAELKKAIKALQDAAQRHRIPIIVVAHLRKTQGYRDKALVPNLDDFHGSSDLTKVANTCVLLGPAPRNMTDEKFLAPTFMKIAKCRADGSINRYASKLVFDFRMNAYAEPYQVGYLKAYDTDWDAIENRDQLPIWAKRAVVPGEGRGK